MSKINRKYPTMNYPSLDGAEKYYPCHISMVWEIFCLLECEVAFVLNGVGSGAVEGTLNSITPVSISDPFFFINMSRHYSGCTTRQI